MPEVAPAPEAQTDDDAAAVVETPPGANGDADEASDSSIPSLEDALKEIAKLRRENAQKRTKAKEIEEKAKQWEEYVESQKTELEKLQEFKATAEDELKKYRREKLQGEVAKEHDLDPELAPLIVGNDLDEMNASARVLAEQLKKHQQSETPSAEDLGAGKRPTPVAVDPNQWFADLFNE